MFRQFKTTYSLNLIPLRFLDKSEYFRHLNSDSLEPRSHICGFGHDAVIAISLYLIIRNVVPVLWRFNSKIILFILLVCLLNFNAFIYFLPVALVEVYVKTII